MGQRQRLDSDYWVAKRGSDVFKTFTVAISTSSNQWKAIWTPATGKKFVLKGGIISAYVSTILSGATVSDPICLFQGSASTIPIIMFGRVVSATDAVGVCYTAGFSAADIEPYRFDLAEGYTATAASTALTVGTTTAISTSGAITCIGTVWGREV